MKSIYLVGFMGSGKTSIATYLQSRLEWPVQDTDQMIEEHYQMNIPSIFKEKGEETFREYETNILHMTKQEKTIVATGGGIIEKEMNRKWLQTNGTVVFLQTSWEEIERRLMDDVSRPIWNNKSRDKQRLLEERLPKYLEVADYVIYTDGKSVEEIASEIISKINA
ncbi:shikimate kinase [Gracilibacillus salitolerans]|uniref:Shikimate kinase n=1 Tax=Gracilibacillus salitolerans TaxID=2663022 RepID=A0A5Q2TLR1_9BACI|nr:shikimate kinase [Gracilibacillus salitolerans]QGH34913.1 shikimate kinase [Gracilibacillus salitolerans]